MKRKACSAFNDGVSSSAVEASSFAICARPLAIAAFFSSAMALTTANRCSRLCRATDAPTGVTFTNPTRGVEVETGGAEHDVHVFLAGSQNFECEWYARKKLFADNGSAKGY
ncbi:hypothetical protein NXC14_CH01644 [Rhizobium sp. NXC14]|nr:hypothetical protein NXC14_CH01644 [Rhizobium sp. NXC14]